MGDLEATPDASQARRERAVWGSGSTLGSGGGRRGGGGQRRTSLCASDRVAAAALTSTLRALQARSVAEPALHASVAAVAARVARSHGRGGGSDTMVGQAAFYALAVLAGTPARGLPSGAATATAAFASAEPAAAAALAGLLEAMVAAEARSCSAVSCANSRNITRNESANRQLVERGDLTCEAADALCGSFARASRRLGGAGCPHTPQRQISICSALALSMEEEATPERKVAKTKSVRFAVADWSAIEAPPADLLAAVTCAGGSSGHGSSGLTPRLPAPLAPQADGSESGELAYALADVCSRANALRAAAGTDATAVALVDAAARALEVIGDCPAVGTGLEVLRAVLGSDAPASRAAEATLAAAWQDMSITARATAVSLRAVATCMADDVAGSHALPLHRPPCRLWRGWATACRPRCATSCAALSTRTCTTRTLTAAGAARRRRVGPPRRRHTRQL